MTRRVKPEWLDQLSGDHPSAIESRRDLRRLNWWMRNASILANVLASQPRAGCPLRLAELGSGDGDLLSRIASRLGTQWAGTHATLVDRVNLVSMATARVFNQAKWDIDLANHDVFDWCIKQSHHQYGTIMANLFLHHFDQSLLTTLLAHVAERTSFFVALEPRRSWTALFFSRLVGLIGCNAVTRHDAPASVCAGFSGGELSRLWPSPSRWQLCERRAGAFGHLFIARAR